MTEKNSKRYPSNIVYAIQWLIYAINCYKSFLKWKKSSEITHHSLFHIRILVVSIHLPRTYAFSHAQATIMKHSAEYSHFAICNLIQEKLILSRQNRRSSHTRLANAL